MPSLLSPIGGSFDMSPHRSTGSHDVIVRKEMLSLRNDWPPNYQRQNIATMFNYEMPQSPGPTTGHIECESTEIMVYRFDPEVMYEYERTLKNVVHLY